MSTGVEALDRLAESLPKTSDKQREAKLDADVLPDNRKVDDLTADELGRVLKKLKIPGASPNNTKDANLAAYKHHLQSVYDEAGEDAILLWHLERAEDNGNTDGEGDEDVRDPKD